MRYIPGLWLPNAGFAIAFFLFCLFLSADTTSGLASRSGADAELPKTQLEILVLEMPGCSYCRIFRRDVVPSYSQSQRAKIAPLRFVDVTKTDISELNLASPPTLVPTIIVMREGREEDRISGYMGPEPFFYMLSRAMRKIPVQ